MLAREFGEWPMLVRAPRKASIYGSGGSAYIDPNDVVGIYKIKGGEFDGKFLVSDEKGSWTLASPDEVKQAFGFVPENAPVLKADQNLTAHIQHARAWANYLENWQMPQYIDGLVDANGKPVDLQKFFTDRNYAVKVVSGYLNSPIIMRKGKTIPLRRRISKDPNRIVDALYALYYGMRFDPDVTMFGPFGTNFWYAVPDIKANGTGWTISNNHLIFVPPFLDDHNDIHSNMDIHPSNPSSAIVYNPFTQPVKVTNIGLYYDPKYKSLRDAYEHGALNASVTFEVTPPGGGKPVEFYFAHLKAEEGFGIWSKVDFLNRQELPGGGVNIEFDDKGPTIKPGEPISHLDNPKNDPLSQGWHTEFGPQRPYTIQDYRIATLMTAAILYHPNPEQYLPPLPKEEGYWFGKKHVVSYRPTVPAVAVKQPDGTVAFANINPRKRPNRLASQLSAYERISGRNPARALRRRQRLVKPKRYA